LLGEEIVHGGMGAVYRATDTLLGREVVVKVLQERFSYSAGAARRFVDEARIAGQLQHPAFPPVHDLGGLPDGRPFLAMKLIKGQTPEELLKARTEVAADRGRFIAAIEQVCQALAYAHSHGVIHRDLKPANVMVGAFGEVQVMDWGLAKVLGPSLADASDAEAPPTGTQVVSLRDSDGQFTQAGGVLGTPAYMPPEQAIGAVDQVDAQSDVFGLGSILAVVLTGRPPYEGDTAESTRQTGARGKVEECFGRLDSCGADPELVAMCKRCLAPDKADRPADAGAVASAVAALRAVADERVRRAELDKVRLEGEKATAEARFLERRKRHRLWISASAALVLALLGGLCAVLYVQHRANIDLESKNHQLTEQQGELEARFELAHKAIATFHTGVSEDALLKNGELTHLRTRLLQEAAAFYGDLQKLLVGKTDDKSRRLLAGGYYQLAELTDKIGDKNQALAVHRRALALRRDLAALPDADTEARLEVARGLRAVGILLDATGERAGAMAAFKEMRDIAAALETEAPSDVVRDVLATSHHNIAWMLSQSGRDAEALAADEKALAIYQKLADASPAVADLQSKLASTHNNIAILLWNTGRYEAALEAYKEALTIRQKLARASPAVTEYQRDLANSHLSIGMSLAQIGRPEEALQTYEKALAIHRKLVDLSPAVTQFQRDLANTHGNIAVLMQQIGRPGEALQAYEKALAIQQELADANPTVTELQSFLSASHNNIGTVLSEVGRPREALQAYEKALAIRQKLADANPAVTYLQSALTDTHYYIGAVLSDIGKSGEALQAYEKSLAIQQKLVDASPTVTDFLSNLARSHNSIGILLGQTGRPKEALQALTKALAIRQKLADAEPMLPDYQNDLAQTLNSLGQLQGRLELFVEALSTLDQSVTLGHRLAKAQPTNPDYQNALAESHAHRGRVHARAGSPAEAATDLRRALELWAKKKSTDLDTRFEKSRAMALLCGLGTEAKSGVTATEVAGLANHAVATLREAIADGWAKPDELNEPDFNSLRHRDDFQQLQKEAQGKAAANHASIEKLAEPGNK
jgi:tetratricopeptide (TPR) repeat protein